MLRRILLFFAPIILILAAATGVFYWAYGNKAEIAEYADTQRKDMRLDIIERSLERELERSEKIEQVLHAQSERADKTLNELEQRLNELTIAVYYQDYTNFFFLTYYCREISELSKHYFSGNSPFAKIKLRLEMAIQRLAYLQQALDQAGRRLAVTKEETATIKTCRTNCAKLEKTYRLFYNELLKEQSRFDKIGEKIRQLDLYANGSTVEQYNAQNTATPPTIDLKALIKENKQPTPANAAEQEQNAAEAQLDTRALEEAKAYGTDTDINDKKQLQISEDLKTEGRLAARIYMALWDPSNPFRYLGASGQGLAQSIAWFYSSIESNYINAIDVSFAASIRRLLIILPLAIIGSCLLCFLLLKPLNKHLMGGSFSHNRLRALISPLTLIILSIVFFCLAANEEAAFLARHLGVAGKFALIASCLNLALIVRLSSRRVRSGVALFSPLIALNCCIIFYCVLMAPSFIVAISSPYLFLICGFWMLWRFCHRLRNLRIAVRVFAVLSIIVTLLGSYFCFQGHYYICMLGTLCWFVFVTNFLALSAISKLARLLARRIVKIPQLQEYKPFIALWLKLLIRQFIIPLSFVMLLWYGLRWPADSFDLAHFLRSWMSHKHDLQSIIRSFSVDDCILIITVGIGLNCLLQISRQTIAMLYHGQQDAGRSQTIMTLVSMLSWGAFVIFALNLMQADYSSMLVVMGGMSVGIGLGLKDTIENIVCGLSLMMGRMRPNDVVECDGIRGRVASVGYRTTTLETYDGSIICFQNTQLFTQNFRNMTRNHTYERATVNIGVTYGTDVNFARRKILEALAKLPALSSQYPPLVNLDGFGDSSVDLAVFVWVPVRERGKTLSAVREAIYNAFNENGIEIPFPQQDLYIKQAVEGAPETPLTPKAK